MVKENYKTPTVCIPDPVASVTGLSVIWTSGDKLTTFASSYNISKVDKAKHFSKDIRSQIFFLKADLLLFDPLLRKLINESCGIFVSAINLRKFESHDNFQVNHLLKLSRKYRSVLRESIENIQNENCRFESESNTHRFNNCIALLYNLEFIWHLTEVMYIDSISDDVALPHVTQWIRFHFPEAERNARKILQTIRDGGSSIEQNIDFLSEGVENAFSEYWDTITVLVLQGNIDLARILLQLHSQSDSDAYTHADKILRTMPLYGVFGELSLPEFNMQWKLWQSNATRRLLSGIFDQYPQLQFLIQVMSGDTSSCIEKLKIYCTSWYQAMVAVLLYTEPTVKFYELGYHAHRFVQHFGGTGSLNFCDATVLALFELDLHSAVKKFQLASDGGWLATHLTHLLMLCGKLELNQKENGSQDSKERSQHLDVKLILEYGTLLMNHHSLWQVGLCYLDQCPGDGPSHQQVLLSHIAPTSEAKSLKLIQSAVCRGLLDVATSICKIEGIKCLRRKQLGKALEWAFRSQDSAFASHLADQFLQHYVKKGIFDSNDLLDNLGSCMLICDRLTFLGKYCEFRRLYIANKFKEAAVCLSDLIASRIAPKYFWLTLLNDALPLLENNDEVPLFNAQQTANLVFCLNDLVSLTEGNMSSLISPAQSSTFERTIGLIRLADRKSVV